MKIIAINKTASFEYFIEDKYEAGIVLQGNEIKSLRQGAVNMNDSFCFVKKGEVTVKNMHIALYDKSDAFSTKDTRRDRRLLLHNAEIAKISGKINRQGYTLVPLKLYFKDQYRIRFYNDGKYAVAEMVIPYEPVKEGGGDKC